MDSREIIKHLEVLKTKSLKGKQSYLVVNNLLDDPDFERVVVYALSPYITFGVNKVDSPVSVDTGDFRTSTWDILVALSTRELTGNTALDVIRDELHHLNVPSQELFLRILRKDLRCGLGANTVNKVKKIIPVFNCQLAKKYDEKYLTKLPGLEVAASVEDKLDGFRALLVYDRGDAKFVSRTGKLFPSVQWLADTIADGLKTHNTFSLFEHQRFIIDGEMTQGDFYQTGAIGGKEAQMDATYHMFDMLPYDEFTAGEVSDSYHKRRLNLDNFARYLVNKNVRILPWAVIKKPTDSDIMRLFHDARDRGKEGVIVKDLTAHYKCNRNTAWLKVKDQQSLDLEVVGRSSGTGKYENTTGVIWVNLDGKHVPVGSGLSDELRNALWKNPEEYLHRIAEIEYHEKTPSGMLRHPRFVRFRDDKTVEDGPGE